MSVATFPDAAAHVAMNAKKNNLPISEASATTLARFFVELFGRNPDFGRALLGADVSTKDEITGLPPPEPP